MGWVTKSHFSDRARGIKDAEADAALVIDINNRLHDVQPGSTLMIKSFMEGATSWGTGGKRCWACSSSPVAYHVACL